MNTRGTFLAALAAALIATTGAWAQDGPPGRFGPRRGGPPPDVDPAEVVARLAQNYEQLAVYDLNRDGSLDAQEQTQVSAAVASGALEPPPFRGPPPGRNRGSQPGGAPDPERIATRMARMYEQIAEFDANRDGLLDPAEQATLSNNLPLFGPGGRGPGAGGPPPELIRHDRASPPATAEQWRTRI